MKAKTIKRYMCDFETTTDANDCRVWAWAMYDIDLLVKHKRGEDIESFFNEVKELSRKTQIDLYFHNLRFDGEFIMSYLLNNEYEWREDSSLKYGKIFNTLITDTGQWYQMKLKMMSKSKIVTFKDSLKIIPLPVRAISKAYDVSMLKGEIDYDKYRPIGYQLDENEVNYLWNDVEIVGRALHQMFSEKMEKLTMASNALYYYQTSQEYFEFWFPQLSDKVDDNIRKAYRGGYTYVSERFQDKIVYDGQTFDVNSLYPYCMYEFDLPYDYPEPFKKKYKPNKRYPIYIQHVRFNFEVKDGFTPIIQAKNKFNRNNHEYLKESGFDVIDMWVTNIDWELIQRHYDVWNVEYLGGYMFKAQKGMFEDYIDYWSDIKKKSTGGLRQLAKLMLNSLYGKFAQRRGNTDKITGETWSILKKPVLVDGVVKYEVFKTEERDTLYTALAVFVTAYARKVLIDAIDNVGADRFVYCDTDSIHILGQDKPDIEIHDKKLGAWKKESSWTRGKFIRAKTYIEEEIHGDELELLVKVAGMPDNLKKDITFDNFNRGYSAGGKLMPTRVKGGVVLKPVTFTIK